MQLKTTCPKCDTSLSVNSELLGKSAKYPRCQTKFIVEDVRSPTSDQSIENAATATETIADGATTTASTAGAKSSPSSAPAIKMLGRFEIQGVLGQGGFGRVYKAYDPQLERLLALKVPTFGPQDGKKAKRFQSEAKAAAQLRHPNIVPTFESGKIGNQFFIASQFIDGEPMSAITKAGRTKGKQAAEWIAKVARALAYAHEMGIVHRDVKPHNVMLDERGEPQLMDFGLAKRLNDDSGMTADGALLGTPAYMAPEQARGDMENVGPHSDQYALGAMLYELLTGQRAFDGAPHAVMAKILSEEPPSPRSLVPKIPRDLEAITQKAMSKEISSRYASCADFADDLDRWLAGDPTIARPMTMRERITRWAKRNRAAALALGAILVSLAVVAVMGLLAAGYQAYAARQIAVAMQQVELKNQEEEKARKEADREKVKAEQQREIAQQQQKDADQQRLLAQNAAAEAERQRKSAEGAAELNRRIAYNAHMNLGQQAWNEGGIHFLHEILERYLPEPDQADLRSFEWYYWWQQSHGYSKKITVPGKHVSAIVFSPNEKTIVTAGDDGRIRIWDIGSGKLQSTLAGPTQASNCLAFSPDGKTLASGGPEQAVQLWDFASGQPKPSLIGPGQVDDLKFSVNGQSLLTAGTEIRIWDLAKGTSRTTLKDKYAVKVLGGISRAVSLSENGKSLAVASNNGSTLWEVETGKLISTLGDAGDQSMCIAFSPDGAKVVTGGWDNVVRLWDVKSHQLLHRCEGHVNHVFDVKYSPDGRIFASAGRDLTVRLWDAATGRALDVLKGHMGRISNIQFSPEGKYLASGGRDATVAIWDVAQRRQPVTELRAQGRVSGVAFSPDCRTLCSVEAEVAGAGLGTENSTVRLWNVESGEEIRNWSQRGGGKGTIWSPDGSSLVTGSMQNRIYAWDPLTGELKKTCPAPLITQGEAFACRCLAFSPDGKLFATNGADGHVNLFDVAKESIVLSLNADGSDATSVVFSPDGRFVAASSLDQTVKIWNASTGEKKFTLQGHQDYVWCVGYAPDGTTIASASRDATVKLWNASTGEMRATLRGHTDTVQWLAFTPDSKTLATTGGDQTVKLWDVATGDLKSSLSGLSDYTYSIAFSADGKLMATGSRDGTVRIWRAATDADVQSQRSSSAK